mmetsp:Transcript_3579/g.8914  ORF Transcript_3579/g.8914 Transcript_3579/m.8914 type:complete len:327 (+) Transcript_3579:1355-2335(+)
MFCGHCALPVSGLLMRWGDTRHCIDICDCKLRNMTNFAACMYRQQQIQPPLCPLSLSVYPYVSSLTSSGDRVRSNSCLMSGIRHLQHAPQALRRNHRPGKLPALPVLLLAPGALPVLSVRRALVRFAPARCGLLRAHQPEVAVALGAAGQQVLRVHMHVEEPHHLVNLPLLAAAAHEVRGIALDFSKELAVGSENHPAVARARVCHPLVGVHDRRASTLHRGGIDAAHAQPPRQPLRRDVAHKAHVRHAGVVHRPRHRARPVAAALAGAIRVWAIRYRLARERLIVKCQCLRADGKRRGGLPCDTVLSAHLVEDRDAHGGVGCRVP